MDDYENDMSEDSVKFAIKIMNVVGEEGDKICVEFSRKQGDHMRFLEAFKKIREGVSKI